MTPEQFAEIVTQHQKQDRSRTGLDCAANLANCETTVKYGRKYINIDIGMSGRYMIEKETGRIYGIKGYGVIHRGHYFGTLETVNEYFWGGYYAHKITAQPMPRMTNDKVAVFNVYQKPNEK